jgi:hypothetical protein
MANSWRAKCPRRSERDPSSEGRNSAADKYPETVLLLIVEIDVTVRCCCSGSAAGTHLQVEMPPSGQTPGSRAPLLGRFPQERRVLPELCYANKAFLRMSESQPKQPTKMSTSWPFGHHIVSTDPARMADKRLAELSASSMRWSRAGPPSWAGSKMQRSWPAGRRRMTASQPKSPEFLHHA